MSLQFFSFILVNYFVVTHMTQGKVYELVKTKC